MPDDVKIGVSTPGAPEAQRQLEQVAGAERKVGAEAGRTGRAAHEGAGRATRGIRELWGTVKGLLGAYLGLAGARRVLASLREETEAIDRATRKAVESLRAVMALSSLKGERAEVQKAIWDMAKGTGIPIEQVAPAYYTLMGGTAGMARERQMALMQQALLMAKTDPRASLEAVVGLFSTMATQQAQLSPEQIGNLVSLTIEQAKATPEEMAGYLPAILTTARAGKVDVGTAAALFSFATRAGGGAAESGTAVRAALLGLLAPSPDVAKQLAGFGYEPAAGLPEKIAWLSRAGGQLPPEMVAALGGRRGLEAIAAIAERPAEYGAEVEMMRGALAAPESLLARRMAEMYGEVPAQRYLDQIKQLDVMIEAERAKPKEMREQAVMKLKELITLRLRESPVRRGVTNWLERAARDVSGEPSTFFEATGERAARELVEEGYAPADVMEAIWSTRVEYEPGEFPLGWLGDPSLSVEEQRRTTKDSYRLRLENAGKRPMQAPGLGPQSSVIYYGGSHWHGSYEDPAGRVVSPANYYG